MKPGTILPQGLVRDTMAPNKEILQIVSDYLKKYDTLQDEDKKLIRGLIELSLNPVVVVDPVDIDGLMESQGA